MAPEDPSLGVAAEQPQPSQRTVVRQGLEDRQRLTSLRDQVVCAPARISKHAKVRELHAGTELGAPIAMLLRGIDGRLEGRDRLDGMARGVQRDTELTREPSSELVLEGQERGCPAEQAGHR